jgi:phospholipid transport system substrate-binding protein
MTFRTLRGVAAVLALTSAIPVMARAASSDPAAQRIDAFDSALIGVMKQGPALGPKGRYRKLEPVVEDAFDLPLMTRFAIGPSWTGMSDADHQSLIRAFARLTTASYAHNFDSFEGERFDVDQVQTRGPDKIVQAHLLVPGHATVALIYRMRESGGGWKIVDVYYDGISQLTTRRSDFAGPLAAGGAKGLTAHLDEASAKLLQ